MALVIESVTIVVHTILLCLAIYCLIVGVVTIWIAVKTNNEEPLVLSIWHFLFGAAVMYVIKAF